jgi:acyl carrier protein
MDMANEPAESRRPLDTAELSAIILECLAELNRSRPADEKLEVSPTAPVFSGSSGLDSLGLVALLTDIEERLADRGVMVTIADERAMSQTRSPFRDVPALLAYLQGLVAQQP